MKCEHCGKEFEPYRSWQKYCSVKCKNGAYYAANREALRLKQAEYRKKNREKVNKKNRLWRKFNLAYARLLRRENYARNREAEKLRSRLYYWAHRAAILVKKKRYRIYGSSKK